MTKDETSQLTRSMAAGDERAVRVFFDRYFDWMLAQARAATGRDEAYCLDVVQDALLRILRAVRCVNSEAQLKAWVKLVVRSVAYDAMRAEARRVRRERGVAVESPECGSNATDADDERLQWLSEQLRQADPELVRLIELRYARRWTLRRIAESMGVSIGTVDGRLRRLLLSLRENASQMDIVEEQPSSALPAVERVAKS